MRPLRILTWHVHGSYLYYLVQTGHDFFLPVRPERGDGYWGRTPSYPWPDNVHEIPTERIRHETFDCILYQAHSQWLRDRHLLLSEEQLRGPQIYLEHDPPREHPTETKHPVDDPNLLLVHVTAFNELMWDNGRTPTCVIEHGVLVPDGVRYTGELERGVVVVNNIRKRGRRLGLDVFERARAAVPLDLVGMGWEEVNGLGEIRHAELPGFQAPYRFFFNPIRYTSLGLSVCEAMMIGLPIVGLATTEMVTVVENGVSGYLDTRIDLLIECMQDLLNDPAEADRLGQGARRTARERFDIRRFIRDWNEVFGRVTGRMSAERGTRNAERKPTPHSALRAPRSEVPA